MLLNFLIASKRPKLCCVLLWTPPLLCKVALLSVASTFGVPFEKKKKPRCYVANSIEISNFGPVLEFRLDFLTVFKYICVIPSECARRDTKQSPSGVSCLFRR